MKNIFDGKRFMSLLQKEAYDFRNQCLGLILGVTSAILSIFLLFVISDNGTFEKYSQARIVLINVLVYVAVLLAPFQLYKRYNHKVYGVNYFMLPASQLEKWLSMFFYCVIVTPIAVILIFALIDLCLYPFFPSTEKTLWITFSDTSIIHNFHRIKFLNTLITLFAFQSLMFLGNIWFQRAKVRKTIVAIFILIAIYITLSLIFVKILGMFITPYASVNLNISTSQIPEVWSIINKTISCLVAPIGLWIVSFMKMKEQQL